MPGRRPLNAARPPPYDAPPAATNAISLMPFATARMSADAGCFTRLPALSVGICHSHYYTVRRSRRVIKRDEENKRAAPAH